MPKPLLALALLVLLPLAARAEEEPRRPLYLSLRGGVATPKHPDAAYWDDGSLVGEASFGWRTEPSIAVEVSVGRFAIGRTYPVTASNGSGTVEVRETLTLVPVLAQARGIAPLLDGAEASVVFGGGFEYAALRPRSEGYSLPRSHDVSPALLLGGGLSAHITRELSMVAEARYVWYGTAKLWNGHTRLDALLLEAGLTWAF
jgi:hypothetical protein